MVVERIALELESLTYAALSHCSAKVVWSGNRFTMTQNELGGQMLIQISDKCVCFELFTCAKDAAALNIALFVVRPIPEVLLEDTDGISRVRL